MHAADRQNQKEFNYPRTAKQPKSYDSRLPVVCVAMYSISDVLQR